MRKPGPSELSPQEERALLFIEQTIEAESAPPTLRQLGKHLDVRSTSVVNGLLKSLTSKGFLTREKLPKPLAPRGLSDEQNERVRSAVGELIGRYPGGQTELGPKLGVVQETLSAFLAGRQGSSFPVAQRVATLMGRDVIELLEGVPRVAPVAPGDDPHPQRAAAANFARANGIREDAILQILAIVRSSPLTAEQWYERMKARALELDEERS